MAVTDFEGDRIGGFDRFDGGEWIVDLFVVKLKLDRPIFASNKL